MLGRLEAAVAAQRAFVSDAGHEMRSPLAAIRTEMEVAQRVGLGERTIDDLLGETGRMERLVADLLLLARADEGAMTLHRDDVDLDDLLDDERRRLRTRPGLTVTAAIAPARIVGDRAALARVVRNLVDNAARHAAGRVHLALRRRRPAPPGSRSATTAPGCPPADRARVFERFVRLDDARAARGRRQRAGPGDRRASSCARTGGTRRARRRRAAAGARSCGWSCPAQPPSGDEQVAGSADGADAVPPERGVDLAAQVADVDLDDVDVAVEVVVPHGAQDRALGDARPGCAPGTPGRRTRAASGRSPARRASPGGGPGRGAGRRPAGPPGRAVAPRRASARSRATRTTKENGLVR